MLGSCTSSSPSHPPERTKGGEHDSNVLANGAITSKIHHVVDASIRVGLPYTPSMFVDLGRLTGPPQGITPFTVAGARSGTPGMSQQEASSVPAIEGERG
jgi:hypothetical protein